VVSESLKLTFHLLTANSEVLKLGSAKILWDRKVHSKNQIDAPED